MHIIFIEPVFPTNQQQFIHALHRTGVKVTAIGESPLHELPQDVRDHLYGYEQIGSVVDTEALLWAVRKVQSREWVDRLETTVEAHVMSAAIVREKCGIPGTTPHTAHLCRDKPAMKEALREAGIPCAQSAGVDTPEATRAFAKDVGFPLILKPCDAAGAAGTYRVDNDEELEDAIVKTGISSGQITAIEEYIEGHEGTYDTLCVDGEVVHDFVCHYYPNVIEGMRNRWISPHIILTNRIDDPTYDEVRAMGKKVIEVLGIGTSATHMEWFFGPKGLKFSEIGCRPAGVRVWDIYNVGNDLNMYDEWAKLIVHGGTDVSTSRQYSTGMIALRPECDGYITGYEGVEEMQSELGDAIIDMHLPSHGTPTQGVEAGFMANAWVRLKHHDYDELRNIMTKIGEKVKVKAHGY